MTEYGRNINYYLLDNSPSGRIKCTIRNWTGVAYKIPRIELEKCKDRSDLAKSGIYFLFGKSDKTGEDVVYVGQSDVRKNGNGILERLREHKRNSKENYWTEAIAFTTSNDFLGATEISWLENHFCVLAQNVNRYKVKNNNEPSPGKPKEEIISDLREFVVYAKIVMGVLGHKLFEPEVPITTDNNNKAELMFFCERNNLRAKGKRTSDGFVVCAGSQVSLLIADYLSKGYREFREKNARLIDKDGILLKDVVCNSPSAASSFVVGKSSNGLVEWKTIDGKTLKEIEASE